MADVIIQLNELKSLIEKKLVTYKIAQEQAACVADALVHADARGVRSHGSIRVEHYCNRIKSGGINVDSQFQFTATAKAAGILNADGGMGHYGTTLAMQEAIKRVNETGIYAVSVQNSSHCGALSYYAQMAIDNNLLSMVMVNTDKCVVPFGAAEPYFGTNPIAYGIPGKKHRILIDMATSEVALGKVIAARAKNEQIPATWGVDKNGIPTTDPYKVVFVTPMAGHKGTAIALAIEGFTGLFTGAFGPHIISMYDEKELSKTRNTMAFVLLINPAIFGSPEAYLQHTDQLYEEMKNLRPAPNIKTVYVPGELEDIRYEDSLKNGCAVYESVLNFLKSEKDSSGKPDGLQNRNAQR
ncbi:MAG: Ldh family oxidoreductase [Treponemataceae bacterium]